MDSNELWGAIIDYRPLSSYLEALTYNGDYETVGRQGAYSRLGTCLDKPGNEIISVDSLPKRISRNTIHVQWKSIYQYFSKHTSKSQWARMFTEYMQVFESRMLAEDYDIRGTLTMFSGFNFNEDYPYQYREGMAGSPGPAS